MSSNNKYRVGDFVYFETNATAPYQIRRLDELIMTPNGVEAKVTCYYRRRDISNHLIQQAEKYSHFIVDFHEADGENGEPLSELERHQVKHRELFYSRHSETLPATHIRGKCAVTLYSDVEPFTSYVNKEDLFYYRLIYDPATKKLSEDRGSMRIGSDFQCDIQPLLTNSQEDPRFKETWEELQWDPRNAPSNSEVDSFSTAAKGVGLYGRACDPSTSLQNPYLMNAAAAASRDITLQFAHDCLFKAGFDVKNAMSLLLPDGHPVVCRDELEVWSFHECALFEGALEKYSKIFPDIITDVLPWKTSKSIVEFYYFWKTTERYTRRRKEKMVAKDSRLKQVYIPDYSKPNSSVLYSRTDGTERGCECCLVGTSVQWYAWGPPTLMCRLCSGCWMYWKKYGGLKNPDKRGGLSVNSRPSPEQRVQDRLEARKSAAAANSVASSNASTPVPADSCGVSHQKAPSHHPHSETSLGSTVFRCTQPNCTKEFRSKDNLATHLAQIHNLSASEVQTSLPVTLSAATGLYQHGAGTQGIHTSQAIRIIRTLCPLLLRPSVLARRPSDLANLTAQQRSPKDPVISYDDLLVRLKTLAKSRIPALRDPQAVLNRKLPNRPISSAIKKLQQRLGQNEDSFLPSKRQKESKNGDSLNGLESPMEKRARLEASENNGTSNGHISAAN
nr:metastasis associated protein MTA1 [Hymenolepis microstoma]